MNGAAGEARRLPAIDVMRGIVMVLMALDHSSEAFNKGRLFTDAAQFYHRGTELPAAQFFIRWVTHLCAPTFLFLAGTALALSIAKQRARGESERSIDVHLIVRGLFIWACELWISYFVMPPGMFVFQVLYAIGTSYLLMVPLRRVPVSAALGLAVAWIVLGEALVGLATRAQPTSLPASLLIVGGKPGSVIVAYPTLHWLALMLLGWVWGQHLLTRKPSADRIARELLVAGAALLVVFLGVRGLNAYGNMMLLRDDGSLVQWLHVGKYPPALSYVSLELAVMCACLSACFWLGERRPLEQNHVLLVLGQTPMLFYLLHFPLLVVSAHALGVKHRLGIGGALLGALGAVLLLYPVCRAYRVYKAAHPGGIARLI
ncbi:MAG: DUF1624 domain-containing protein [Myxococcota bacterium]